MKENNPAPSPTLRSRTLAQSALALIGLLLAAGSSNAQTIYQWNGGADLTTTNWATPANWAASPGVGGTNGTFFARLNVNNATRSQLVYTEAQGTTVYSNNSANARGLVVGSGTSGSGTFTILGGTFSTVGSSGQDAVGNSDNNTGTLNISGGTYISSASGLAVGLGGGNNRTSILNVNSGLANIARINVNTLRATINLNGGTLAVSNIAVSAISGVNATNNFNGGILKARGSTTSFFPLVTLAIVQCNVRDGGAIFDTDGFNISVGQPLLHSSLAGDAAIDGGLTKQGLGTLTFNGTNTYTGPTRLIQGALVTRLPASSSLLEVQNGTALTVSPSSVAWSPASVAITNAALTFNLGAFNGDTNSWINTATLSKEGTITVNVAGTGLPLTNLTLMTYAATNGGGSFVLGTLPNGAAATLVDTGTSLELLVTAPSIQNLVWSGGDGIWQTGGAANWNNGTAIYLEYPGNLADAVVFNDTFAGGIVNIQGIVRPNSITVDDTTSFYTFSGAGTIGGTNGIAKLGTSTLTINTSNDFSGPVTISGGSGTVGGTLFVNHPNALGDTTGTTLVNGPANTLEIGTPFGPGVGVTNETVTINGPGVGGARGALRGTATGGGDNVWAGPIIVGTDFARIGTEDGGNLTVAGPITDNGLNLGLLLRPGQNGTVTMAGTGHSYGATRTFGHADGSGIVKLGANNALSTNRLELGIGPVDLGGFNQTVGGMNDISGPGTIVNNGAAPATFTLHTGTNNFFSGGNLTDGSSLLNVVKLGSGRQVLAGATLSYSGPTLVGEGHLSLATTNPMATSITVANGATLSGEITTTGSLTLNANSILQFDPSTPTALTAATIDATASPILVNFTAAASPVTPSLVLSAAGGITGSAANFTAAGVRGGTFFLTNGNTELMFIAAGSASLTWKGTDLVNPTFWDTTVTTNWSNGASPDQFYVGDSVLLDDTAATNFVAIQGPSVAPASVTVSAATNYTISGAGISGGASLTKNGSGTLTMAGPNTYNGVTLINSGTVIAQNNGALGSSVGGTTVASGATIDFGGSLAANSLNLGTEVITISGTGVGGNGALVNNSFNVQINAMRHLVLAGNASVGGLATWDFRVPGELLGGTVDMAGNTLTKVGTNQVSFIASAFSNPGHIVVSQGILGLHRATDLGGSSANTFTVQSGGFINFYEHQSPALWSLVLNSNATVFPSAYNAGIGGTNHWIGPVTLNGPVNFQANASMSFGSGIAGPGSITKTGTGFIRMYGTNTYTGNTTINGGRIIFFTPSIAPASTVAVTNGATIELSFAETNEVSGLILGGVVKGPGVYNNLTDPTYILGAGSLAIAAPPTLNFTNTGSTLEFSWTGSFKLQVQTNSLNVGLSTNWSDYPGGGSSPVSVPVDAANGSVFFRLSTP